MFDRNILNKGKLRDILVSVLAFETQMGEPVTC